jgi:hypothetical protein
MMSDPDPNPDPECIPVPKADILGGGELVGEAQLSSDFFLFVDFCQFILCRIRIQFRIRAFRFWFHNSYFRWRRAGG